MNAMDIRPGTYRLLCDLPAIGTADSRVKHDWKKMPLKSGTRIVIELESISDEEPRLYIRPVSEVLGVPLESKRYDVASMLSDIEPMIETPTSYLQRTCGVNSTGSTACRILERLFEQGRISMNELDSLASKPV